jgi:hypothetical protein
MNIGVLVAELYAGLAFASAASVHRSIRKSQESEKYSDAICQLASFVVGVFWLPLLLVALGLGAWFLARAAYWWLEIRWIHIWGWSLRRRQSSLAKDMQAFERRLMAKMGVQLKAASEEDRRKARAAVQRAAKGCDPMSSDFPVVFEKKSRKS